MRQALDRGERLEAEWERDLESWAAEHPDLASEWARRDAGRLADGWDAELPVFAPEDGKIATRAASGQVLDALARRLPELMGGSADLTPSNKTLIEASEDFARDAREGRNVRFGVREHAMGTVASGMALHGGLIPYAGTFLIFSDYMRPSVRLAALMGLRVVYVYTHDSVGLGEDGPTHQPIEHLASLRAIPGLTVLRPADANEVREAWKVALARDDGPAALVLTRHKLPVIDRDALGAAGAEQLGWGAYVLVDVPGGGAPEIILIASGSEVPEALEAWRRLVDDGVRARLVSLPSFELFEEQDREYRDRVLPPEVGRRLSVEAGASLGWERWVGDRGAIVGIDRFGASAPGGTNLEKFGFTADSIEARARELLAG